MPHGRNASAAVTIFIVRVRRFMRKTPKERERERRVSQQNGRQMPDDREGERGRERRRLLRETDGADNAAALSDDRHRHDHLGTIHK